MNQFTSHLDFSLTKKRLLMMGKRISRTKLGSLLALTLPVLIAITLLFCTDTDKTNGYFYNGFLVVDEPELHFMDDQGQKIETSLSDNKNHLSVYVNGTLFSGVQQTIDVKTNKVLGETTFSEGLPESAEYFNQKFSPEIQRSEFSYSDDRWTASKFDWDNNFTGSNTRLFNGNVYVGGQMFNAKGVLVFEVTLTDSLKAIRSWYDDGTLKDESFVNENGYQGLMTLYSENGEIKGQERYENGELIEKIK